MKMRVCPVFSPFLHRSVLLGCSFLALSMGGGGGAIAQESHDLGVPPDVDEAPAEPDSLAQGQPVQPAVPALVAPAPAENSAENPAAPVAQPSPAATTASPAQARSPAEPEMPPLAASAKTPSPEQKSAQAPQLVEPVAEPKGSDLASPSSVTPPSQEAAAETAALAAQGAAVNTLPASAEAAVAGGVAPAVSPAPAAAGPAAKAPVDDDLFYDANELVPEGEMAQKSLHKVDPKLEPATRLVIVTKDSGPGSRDAEVISAARAMKLGRYDAALDIYRSLYQKNRKDSQVLMGIAVSLQRMGDFEASIAAYQELLDVQPKNTDAEVNMLGLMSEKYPSVALRRLVELREKNPSNIAIVAQLAVTQAQLNNTQEAIKYLSVAASMQPDNPSHVYNMAVIADRAGNRKAAVKYYEQALEMDSIYGGGRTLPRDVIFERLARLR